MVQNPFIIIYIFISTNLAAIQNVYMGGKKSRRSDQDCETEEKKYNAALQGNSFSTFSCTFWKSNFNKFEMSGHSA